MSHCSLVANSSSFAPDLSLIAEQFQSLNALSFSPSVGSFSSSPSGISTSTWVFDFGATHHMSRDSSLFASTYSPPSVSVLAANCTHMSLAGVGAITSSEISLLDVYYIPQPTLNLISVKSII